jgi:formate dehydrogenase major subunit
MGVTQHTTGTEGVMSLSNLALLCGNIGIESGGINPCVVRTTFRRCDMGGLLRPDRLPEGANPEACEI